MVCLVLPCPVPGANTNTVGMRGAGANEGTECVGTNGACTRGVGGGAVTVANVRVRAGVWVGVRGVGARAAAVVRAGVGVGLRVGVGSRVGAGVRVGVCVRAVAVVRAGVGVTTPSP